jgi:hypothetical protein
VYPADPPTVDEIVAVMRQTPPDRHGLRLRALIVVLWRGGLRIQEALSLIESDLDPRRGSILIRRGKGNRRREVGMDAWAWGDHLAPWLAVRVELPVGALFCVIDGPTRGRPWSATAARGELRRYAAAAGVRRRFAPHHYADLLVMPIERGEVLQVAYVAVGRVGMVHGHSQARLMSGARKHHGRHWRPFLERRRAEHPTNAIRVGAFRGSGRSARPSDEALHPHWRCSPRREEHATARRRVMPTSLAQDPGHTRRLSDSSA